MSNTTADVIQAVITAVVIATVGAILALSFI